MATERDAFTVRGPLGIKAQHVGQPRILHTDEAAGSRPAPPTKINGSKASSDFSAPVSTGLSTTGDQVRRVGRGVRCVVV